jgi:large subunit ribosomal protein L15
VNVGSLDIFDDGSVIDTRAIQAAGLANGNADGVKILARGEITKKLTIKVQAFSASAKAKIEGVGGSCEVTPLKKLTKSEREA